MHLLSETEQQRIFPVVMHKLSETRFVMKERYEHYLWPATTIDSRSRKKINETCKNKKMPFT